jgi:hypothetical protein
MSRHQTRASFQDFIFLFLTAPIGEADFDENKTFSAMSKKSKKNMTIVGPSTATEVVTKHHVYAHRIHFNYELYGPSGASMKVEHTMIRRLQTSYYSLLRVPFPP